MPSRSSTSITHNGIDDDISPEAPPFRPLKDLIDHVKKKPTVKKQLNRNADTDAESTLSKNAPNVLKLS